MAEPRYRDIDMVESFVLETQAEDGSWIDERLCRAEDFSRLEDGAYVLQTGGGSPLFLRCVRQDGDIIEHVDGTGAHFIYRMVPYPSHRYWPSGTPRPPS